VLSSREPLGMNGSDGRGDEFLGSGKRKKRLNVLRVGI
jgi:hypothetical protein